MTGLQECVLIVDDEFVIAESLCIHMEEMGLIVCGTAATAESAIALAQRHRPKLVLMDVRLRGEGDGVDAALAIHASVGSKVIFITGSQEPTTMARIALDQIDAQFRPRLCEFQREERAAESGANDGDAIRPWLSGSRRQSVRLGVAIHPRQHKADGNNPERSCNRIIEKCDQAARVWQNMHGNAHRDQGVNRYPNQHDDCADQFFDARTQAKPH